MAFLKNGFFLILCATMIFGSTVTLLPNEPDLDNIKWNLEYIQNHTMDNDTCHEKYQQWQDAMLMIYAPTMHSLYSSLVDPSNVSSSLYEQYYDLAFDIANYHVGLANRCLKATRFTWKSFDKLPLPEVFEKLALNTTPAPVAAKNTERKKSSFSLSTLQMTVMIVVIYVTICVSLFAYVFGIPMRPITPVVANQPIEMVQLA